MPFSRSKSVEFLFHQLPFKFLWYTGKVLLARLVHLCSGFTKSTIFCDGLAQTTKFTKLTIFCRTKSGAADLTTDSSLLCKITTHDPQSGAVDLTILREIAKHKKIPVFFAILSQLFSKCYGDKNTSSKRCCRYAFFYNRSASCKFWKQKEKH